MRVHFEPHDAVGLYATNALRPLGRRSFELHLARCERCQADVESLDQIAVGLGLVVEPVEPPPALRRRILAAARSEGDTP